MKSRNELPKLIPNLSEEVKRECVGGVYEIHKPTISEHTFTYGEDRKTVKSLQLRCQSLFVKRPDTVCKCNSLVKTIIGGGTGDQTELIECGRCRTSYLVRTIYDETGHLEVRIEPWDLGRNVKKYAELRRDKDYRIWVSFNDKK